MTKKCSALLALALGFFLARAEITLAQIPPVAGAKLLTCKGYNFRGTHEYDQFSRSLGFDNHTADFEILLTPGKSYAVVQADYTFPDEGVRARAHRTITLENVNSLADGYALFGSQAQQYERVGRVIKAGDETYVSRRKDLFFGSEFLEYITFPQGSSPVSGGPIPVNVRIEQATNSVDRSKKDARWSVFYYAECTPKQVAEEKEPTSVGVTGEAESTQLELPLSPREALFPSLRGALGSISIYSAEGEFLAGKAATIGGAAVTATVATQIVRAVMARLARSPMVAAYFLPFESAARFRIDVKATGLAAEQAQAFFAASARTQEKLCAENDQYRAFCQSVSALDFEIARQQGRAL